MDGKPAGSRQMNPLDTMASGIAHELNNILYPMVIYTNLLLNNAEAGSEEYSDLNEILDCANRAGELISKIRLYSGQIESAKTVSDLGAIISEAMCDAAQIRQVLTNLCTNAVQAITGAGKIKVTVESVTLEGFECFDRTILSGGHARLVVTDNGSGMHEATLARIFDPFFTTHTQATGLGLSTVIGIVRSHGGGISISSKPDIGTTVEVFLPLAEGNLEELAE